MHANASESGAANRVNGSNGNDGPNGSNGTNGSNGNGGPNGSNGPNRSNGTNGSNGASQYGKMTLMEAAFLVERLQARAAHAGEVEALKMARDALLTIVAEGYRTLGDRLGRPGGAPLAS